MGREREPGTGVSQRQGGLADHVLEGQGPLPGGDLLDVADTAPHPHLAQAAEPIALRFSCAHHSRTDASFGTQEALVIAHRVEDLLDRRLDVDVDPNLVHPFMLHPHQQTAFALAPG